MIRPLLRSFVYTAMALGGAAQLSGGGIIFARGIETFVLASFALGIGNHFVRPILNILLLPINLVSLGLFRWVTSVVILYVITLVVQGFRIVAFDFPGYTFQGIFLPEIHLAGIGAIFAVSFVISFISSFLYWLGH